MPSLNPNHPVIRQVEDYYYKLLAAHMLKHGEREWNVTAEEVSAIKGLAVALDTRGGGLVVRIITCEEGKRLAREHGGLPH